jgi:signal transduction histidine kinase
MPEKSHGKLSSQDQMVSGVLTWMPWLLSSVAIIPLPGLFLALFFISASTDSAAFYLLLSFVSLGLGLVVGLLIFFFFWMYRRRWNRRLRERLAADGITATEVPWFQSELSSEEKRIWRELKEMNPLLADAYCETLAARLTATRIAARARGEMLRVERQINRARHLRETDTTSLMTELMADREQAELVHEEAKVRLAEAKARLQTIDAAARRALSRGDTRLMLQRLSASQEQLPLALEMTKLEQEVRKGYRDSDVNEATSTVEEPTSSRNQ